MEINVGTKFSKVGTTEIVTVVKYDPEKGTVIVKFPSGKSIPMSTGSLMKTEKWKCLNDEEETVAEEKVEKPKKEKKRKSISKKSVSKIRDEVEGLLSDYVSEMWDELDYCRVKESKILIWDMVSNKEVGGVFQSIPQFRVEYHIKEKQFNFYYTDAIAEIIKGTEFDGLCNINTEFIEDKLKELLDVIVARLNEKTESEDN